jgi:regulator of protease activity HflC (stomatin/prohibitin superfamily)
MFFSTLMVAPIVLPVAALLSGMSVKILREYERAVVFTLGRFQRAS